MPIDAGYTYLYNTYGYENNYINMNRNKSDMYSSYGCWVLSQKELENYKEKIPDGQKDLIYEILSKETEPLKLVNYFKNHPSICLQDTKFFKEITL